MKLFVKCGVEYAVMETGIGGRLDATNYVRNPLVTVITPISFDHVALLGNTIEAIASEKAGIIKPNVPLVLSRQPYAAATDVVKRRAAELSAPVFAPEELSEAEAFLPQDCPQFLRENFTSSLKAVRLLGVEPSPEKFTMPQLRARFECIHQNPIVVLDGAHNADSMQKLVAAINEKYAGTHWNVVLGAVKGKDVHGMAQALRNLDADFILTNPHTGKGSALPLLIEEANAAGLHIYMVIETLNERSQLPLDKPLLFTGSFFTALIGEELFGK
jgi:dihydrofolate synthase/folylpolyglutamate synthase